MLLVIILIFLSILLPFLPDHFGKKKNPYDLIRQAGGIKENRTPEEYGRSFWNVSIKVARKLEQLVPLPKKTMNREKLQDKINYAGMQKVISVEDVQAVRNMYLLAAVLYFAFLYLLTQSPLQLALGLAASLLAFYIPESAISIRAKKRQEQISHELPGFLTSLAIITDAGLNLVPAIEVLVRQDKGKGEFLKEMGKAMEEIQIGISQPEAFTRLSDRCNVEEIHYFISALLQGIEKGNAGLTLIIRQQAEESWQKRKYKAKEIAEKASMKLFLPLLCMVFPAFAIFLIGPMIFSLMNLFKIM